MWPYLWIRFAGLGALNLEDLGRSAIYSSAAHWYASAMPLEVCLSLKAKWVMALLPMLHMMLHNNLSTLPHHPGGPAPHQWGFFGSRPCSRISVQQCPGVFWGTNLVRDLWSSTALSKCSFRNCEDCYMELNRGDISSFFPRLLSFS